jgi:putative endopeptidase
MPKTKKQKTLLLNKTKKCQKYLVENFGFKPFEKKFKEFEEAKKSQSYIVSKYKPIVVKNIKPSDNFYNYINYNWLKRIKVKEQQRYITQVDDFRLTQDKVYNQLHDIIVDYIKHNNSKFAQNMRNYYKSVINMNSKKQSREKAFEIISKIDELRGNKDNIWKMLAFVNSSEITSSYSPLSWSVYPDNKQPDIFRCYIDGYTFAIVDQSVYDNTKNNKYNTNVKKYFIKTIKNLFNTVLGPNHGLIAEDVFDVEEKLYNVWKCYYNLHENSNGYNKITAADALKIYGFDWEQFSKELGFDKTPPFFISSSPNYLKCCVELLMNEWNSEKWRSFWCWIYLRFIARITKDWEKVSFSFYGEYQRGQERINTSDAVSSALYMSLPFNTFLTREYVAKYENPAAIQYVKVMCEDLKEVFYRIISRNKWLKPSTKKYALKKIKFINFVVGKPDKLILDPDIDYDLSIYDNLIKLMDYRHKFFIRNEGKPAVELPIMDWTQYPVKMTGSQSYIVNASYTPSKNSIYINLGYIQTPFVDLDDRGIEFNLAHIGFTVGHELSHSLDDWGSQYDYTGKLNDWWTDEDKRRYKKIQQDVIKQYEEFAKRDGIIFDASLGIGEDLADISGMSICNEYLSDFQQKNSDLIPIRNLSFDAFYTYYAFQQKQKISKKAIAAQIRINPHPLDVYRCNIPLSRSDIFRNIYNVKEGDGMWWHNTNTIW